MSSLPARVPPQSARLPQRPPRPHLLLAPLAAALVLLAGAPGCSATG